MTNTLVQLDSYFKKTLSEFDLPIDPSGTDFQKKVWQSLQSIPLGNVLSYQKLAEQVDSISKTRAVASAIAKNPILIIGEDAITGVEGKQIMNLAKLIANKFNFIKEGWNGFNFLAKNTGLINGLELGFVNKGGIKEIVDNQEIKTIFLLGVDDDIDFNALKDKFIIYLGSHGDNGANVADIILPCPAYTEKEATFINFEGRAQISSLSTFPIGDAKAEWQFILEIAKKMSITLDFDDISQLRMLISNHKAIANLNNPTPESAISLNEEVNILDSQLKIIAQKYDFYLTNVIARASRILNRCSTFNDNK